MRRIPALLCVAGLAAAPASAAAGPSPASTAQTQTVEKFEWSTSQGRLGVMVMSLTPELRKHFGAPTDRGVLVAHVEPGTPAANAGIDAGRAFASPFDEPSWFREWLSRFDPAKHDTSSGEVSTWFDKLRELFAPKTGMVYQRS